MLFPSTLVVASGIEVIDDLLKDLGHLSITNNPDIFLLSEYTIESVRTIGNFLSLRPYGHDSKIVIIPRVDLLNTESQNTILKNLEEPGQGNHFILITDRPHSLLPTIVSRCRVINRLEAPTATDTRLTFPSDLVSALQAVETLPKDKSELQIFLENQIRLYQQHLVTHPTPETAATLNRLLKSIKLLNANVDAKTTADYLMLSGIQS